MAITNFQSTVWSTKILENLNNNLVYGSVVNVDYEGDILNQGDTVKINSIGAVTIGDYDKTTGLSTPEELTDSSQSLLIDQAKYYNFRVDDIDKAQSNANIMGSAILEAAYGLANVADSYIAGLYTDVDSDNTIGDDTTPIVPTPDDAYSYIVDLGVVLDEANVPEIGRFVVVPSWFYSYLLKDDRFTEFEETLHTGKVGNVNGMTVKKSNNVPNTDGELYKIMAGYKGAISFANQITDTEAYRPESFFADAVKGLHVYGAKLVRPSGIAVLTANKA